jgi:transcriptional regulator GlxA family with amidase domain
VARDVRGGEGLGCGWPQLEGLHTAFAAARPRAASPLRRHARADANRGPLGFASLLNNGDGEIRGAQHWLSAHFSVANPVEEMIRRSKLAERTFKRRFVGATGLTPIAYVQRLRIEDAKRRLERTDASIDEVGWRVGYEDPAFVRHLFKRITGLAPSAYRDGFACPNSRGLGRGIDATHAERTGRH